MSIDSSTKNSWIYKLTSTKQEISKLTPEGKILRGKLEGLIDEIAAIESVEIAPAKGSTPALILITYMRGLIGIFALPASEDVLSYVNTKTRRKSRPALNAELAALNVATHEKSPETVALMTEDEIDALLDTSADRLGQRPQNAKIFKASKLFPSLFVLRDSTIKKSTLLVLMIPV